MVINDNGGGAPNYYPNMQQSVEVDPSYALAGEQLAGKVGRYAHQHKNTDFEQPRALWNKVFTDTDRKHVVENIVGFLGKVTKQDIKERQCRLFYQVDPAYGEAVAKGVGVSLD